MRLFTPVFETRTLRDNTSQADRECRPGGPIADTRAVPFHVLYVCTGNVCRSPMAELLLRSWAAPDADVVVTSAGTAALVGAPIDHASASILGQLGIDPMRHRGRQFEAAMALQADLVLTAEVGHRDTVMTAAPSAFRRTFTMKEFARLARRVEPGEPRSVVELAARARGTGTPTAGRDDDVPDPFGTGITQTRPIAQQVSDTVHAALYILSMLPNQQPRPRPSPVDRRPRPAPVAARRPRPHRS